MDLNKRKSAVAWLSVFSNTTLIILKIIVGLAIGSVSVISEAIHSGVDLLAAVIALLAVKQSAKPADEKHPFGHGKFENLSGTIEALLIFVAAGWILYEAVKKLLYTGEIEAPFWGVAVMGVSATANWVVSHFLFKVGKQTDSVALQADAWHLRTDVYTSLGVLGGLALLCVGEWLLPKDWNLHWIDPVAAILVAMLIIKEAYTLTVRSARDLIDMTLPPEEERWIRDTLKTFRPAVHGFHRMRTRKAGSERFIEFHIFVDAEMTVDKSHRLSHEIARRIEEHFGQSHVVVHVEPCRGDCTANCAGGCLLDEEERQDIHAARKTGRC